MNRPDTRQPAPSPDELSRQLQVALRRFHRSRWFAAVVIAAVVVAAIAAGSIALVQDERRLAASCSFFRDLGDLPLTVTPPAKHPSQIAVALIVH